MTQVFVSYSRKDKAIAGKLTEELHQSELETWIDWQDIPPTADWLEQIHKGIERSDGFLFLLSPDSVVSEVCGGEIAHAVQNAKRLIPIVVRDVNPKEVNPALAKVNWIYCREQDDFNEAIHKILSAIRTDLAWVEAHRRLQVRALEWEKSKEASVLLRGRDLSTAEEQLATAGQRDPQPTDLQRQYILESRRRESRSRNTALSIGTVVLIALALLSLFANNQRILADDNAKTAVANANAAATERVNAENQKATAVANANIALARQLAVQASVAGSGYSEDIGQLRGLLAVESLRRFPTSAADEALRSLGDFWKIQKGASSPDNFVTGVTMTRDGKLAAWIDQSGIVIEDVDRGKVIKNIPSELSAYDIMFSSDGKWMATRGGVWNMATQVRTITLPEEELITATAFSQDGTRIAFGGDSGRIRILDSATGAQIATLDHGSALREIAFSPDGQWVASGGEDGHAKVWKISTSQLVSDLVLKGPIDAVIFSPQGNELAVASLTALTVQVWDTSRWKMMGSQALQNTITFMIPELLVQFSPDGNWIVSQVSDGTLLVWQASDGKEIARLYPDNSSTLYEARFSPNEKWIAAGDLTGKVHIWEIATKLERVRATLELNSISGIMALEFSPDGKWITTIDDKGTVEKWLWRTDDLVESACKNFLTRNLYTWEWTQYFGNEPYRATCSNFPPAPEPTSTLITIMTLEAQSQLTSTAESLSTATP